MFQDCTSLGLWVPLHPGLGAAGRSQPWEPQAAAGAERPLVTVSPHPHLVFLLLVTPLSGTFC